jgi:hypothetical protein
MRPIGRNLTEAVDKILTGKRRLIHERAVECRERLGGLLKYYSGAAA